MQVRVRIFYSMLVDCSYTSSVEQGHLLRLFEIGCVHCTLGVCSRPVLNAVGVNTDRARGGRTHMRTPLFLLFTMVLSARNACYGMAPGVEAAARWSHVPINAEVHSMPERLGLPAGRRLLDTDDVLVRRMDTMPYLCVQRHP